MIPDTFTQRGRVPRLWNDTIQAHRAAVRDAILDTTAALVSEHGLLSVTMSQIAEATGIGRATLYKYFPDVEAILVAWHERQVTAHLTQLAELRDQAGDPGQRLQASYCLHALGAAGGMPSKAVVRRLVTVTLAGLRPPR
jgi:AcrR family transcriptional regulator